MEAKIYWQEEPNMPNAQKLDIIRYYRAKFLAECDWTQLPDAVLTEAERTAWQDYRQALRDIPQSFTNPDDVIFPTEPT